MQYPDGGFVDVFVAAGEAGRYLVTDFGDTLGWLRMNSTGSKLSPNLALIDDVALTRLDRGHW